VTCNIKRQPQVRGAVSQGDEAVGRFIDALYALPHCRKKMDALRLFGRKGLQNRNVSNERLFNALTYLGIGQGLKKSNKKAMAEAGLARLAKVRFEEEAWGGEGDGLELDDEGLDGEAEGGGEAEGRQQGAVRGRGGGEDGTMRRRRARKTDAVAEPGGCRIGEQIEAGDGGEAGREGAAPVRKVGAAAAGAAAATAAREAFSPSPPPPRQQHPTPAAATPAMTAPTSLVDAMALVRLLQQQLAGRIAS